MLAALSMLAYQEVLGREMVAYYLRAKSANVRQLRFSRSGFAKAVNDCRCCGKAWRSVRVQSRCTDFGGRGRPPPSPRRCPSMPQRYRANPESRNQSARRACRSKQVLPAHPACRDQQMRLLSRSGPAAGRCGARTCAQARHGHARRGPDRWIGRFAADQVEKAPRLIGIAAAARSWPK